MITKDEIQGTSTPEMVDDVEGLRGTHRDNTETYNFSQWKGIY